MQAKKRPTKSGGKVPSNLRQTMASGIFYFLYRYFENFFNFFSKSMSNAPFHQSSLPTSLIANCHSVAMGGL